MIADLFWYLERLGWTDAVDIVLV